MRHDPPSAFYLHRPDGKDRRVPTAVGMLSLVVVVGTTGYTLLGLPFGDALYQTIITVSTVGYSEVGAEIASPGYRAFTAGLILAGVGTAFYTLGVLFELLVEGRLTDQLWRRRMESSIDNMSDHVIVCGWGRVGQTIAHDIAAAGRSVVVVEHDPERVQSIDVPYVEGDATDEDVLTEAGIERASSLVAAVDADAVNLYITLTARSMHPDLFIVARAHVSSAEAKLTQAGANRVVNPQYIGGERIAAMVLQPSVADFLDVVMRDDSLEFRLGEIRVRDGSPVAGRSLRDAHLRDRTGALVLAMRSADGSFHTNPPPDTLIRVGEQLIVIGTPVQLKALRREVGDD